jgi:SAM-dependent methyltransferase
MSEADRARWEQRYADLNETIHRGPHRLLARHAPPAWPGCRALELACGLGRDALWLAAQGWQVDALDISLTALIQARADMLRQGLSGVHFVAADLDHFPLPRRAYDLVMVFRFLDRSLFPAIVERVRPGGLVIYETLNIRWRDTHPTTRPEHMLHPGELPGYFPGWTVIEASDSAMMSAFVGRKP